MRNFMVVLGLMVERCLAGLTIEGPREDKPGNLIGAAVKILKTCYGLQINTMCLARSMDGIPLGTFFEQSIAVTLINDTSRASVDEEDGQKSLRRIQVFVVAGSSSTELTEILDAAKDSMWWNHLASFMILSWSSISEDDCSKAYEILWAAWKLDVLNAKLLCVHPAEGPMIYGFNPFTDKAPYPWKLENTYIDQNGHPWTLFARRFQEDEEICEELDFQKENDLGGYEIRSGLLLGSVYWSIDANKTGTDRFGGAFGNVAAILCRTLNATCTPRVLNLTEYSDPHVFNRISDIFLFPRSQFSAINFTTIYPHWQSGLGITSRFSGDLSQLAKIISVIDRVSRYGVCVVLFITLVFFKYCLRLDLMSSILNDVRLICNGSIENVPLKQSLRIYLAGVFIFSVTIQALYQGKLASLLTTSVSLPNLDTLEDLAKSHHRIYVHKSYASFFKDSIFEGRYVVVANGHECFQRALHNSSACCVGDRYFVIKSTVENNLHLSSDTISKDHWVYQIRENWPLQGRVNTVVQRMVEADLVTYWHMKHLQTTIQRSKYYAQLDAEEQFKNINLEDLNFAFVILGIGLTIASAVFFIEFRRRHRN